MKNLSMPRPVSYAQLGARKCVSPPHICRSSDVTLTSEQLSLLKQKKTDEGLTFALQALLDRHETYVKESQIEQARSAAYILELELERANLQANNATIVAENRELLMKLEQVNAEFGGTDQRVKELEGLLENCEQEVRRLNGLTHRTLDLENKLEELERDRTEALQQVQDCKIENRSTIARWRESERKVKQLEKELRNIEMEAKLDRQKHEEIVARISRDRELERELGLSEGRLKASAAVQKMQDNGPREKQVVSNFVRDILQDNANLQAGVAELRQLLQSSNEEVQSLREQIMLHQPISEESQTLQLQQPSLADEIDLSQSAPKSPPQQVHVHHHYHTEPRRIRTPSRRLKQRRGLISGTTLSSPGSTTPSTPSMRSSRFLPTPGASLPIEANRVRGNRWSMQSSRTGSTYLSSMASSPHSYLDGDSSVFDRMDYDDESSRPTSPDLSEVNSPMPFSQNTRKLGDALSIFEEEEISPYETPLLDTVNLDHDETPVDDRPTSAEVHEDLLSELTPKPSINFGNQTNELSTPQTTISLSTIPYVPDPSQPPDVAIVPKTEHTNRQSTQENNELPLNLDLLPSRRRRNSTDSLVSISGMDIHIAQQPSSAATSAALALLSRSRGANKHHFAPSPVALTARKISGSAQPLAIVTDVAAMSRPGIDTASASMMALNGIAREQSKPAATVKSGTGLFGSWISKKWRVAPVKSVADLRSASHVASASLSPSRPSMPKPNVASTAAFGNQDDGGTERTPSSSDTLTRLKPKTDPSMLRDLNTTTTQIPTLKDIFGNRPPGINQLGIVPGFAAVIAARATPVVVNPQQVDIDGLKHGLAED